MTTTETVAAAWAAGEEYDFQSIAQTVVAYINEKYGRGIPIGWIEEALTVSLPMTSPTPAIVPDGCHVVRYNGDGEFGQKVGWLYRTGGDPCVISGKPVYVWRPIAELLETTV